MLRAINLGSHNRISMPRLEQLFRDLGHRHISTYVQSGNVVFSATTENQDALRSAIERRITADLGLKVTVLLRSAVEFAALAAKNPFVRRGADPAGLHVTFLACPADLPLVAAVSPDVGQPDAFEITGRDIFLNCPNGYGRSKLNNAFWERRLRQPATTRNWKTVTALRDMTKVAEA
ncbi:MAG TPA: DUF1697 domain-containing protein [Chloroflexota bacterium]|jgi:uncharacterized protein (DUF1697 family)|nr:DUF1697 domain-containing protein [Chloroflexota bacterium]